MTDIEKIATLTDALRDIKFGAQMMLEIPNGGAVANYAKEVERVSQAALQQAAA